MTTLAELKRWTPVEEARLQELWPTHTLTQLADLFDRTPKALMLRADKIGLVTRGRFAEMRAWERRQWDAPAANGHAERAPAPEPIDLAPVASVVADLGEALVTVGETVLGPPVEVVVPGQVSGPPEPDELDAALAQVARLARAGSGQVATLTTERDALRAVTEQQAGLIAAYQAALGGRAFDASADELLRVEAERNAVADECNRVDGELAELQRAYRALGEERNELLADNERLMVQLATTPAATVPSGVDTSGYEAELRRCWLVIAWLRKAIGEGMACRLLGVPDVVGLVSQADQFAEVGRQAAEGVRRQREAVPHG